MTGVVASVPQGRILYTFTPNITFNRLNKLGNILCGYEKDVTCQVRDGNVKLHEAVQKWCQKDALDEDGKVIPLSDKPEDGNLKLVRMGR